jgi:hypothetical protein
VRAEALPRLLLALSAPLLVLLPAWDRLSTRPAWAPTSEVAQMNEAARAGPADVVLVGPSFARTDVDTAALGAALAPASGGKRLRVVRFAQNLASAPAWYAILKERVYGNGLSPRLVLLVATPDYLLEVRPPASRMAGLEQHFAEPDAVLRARTWNTRWPAAVQRALDQRSVLRDPVVAWFRDGLVNLCFGDGGGADLAAAAGESLFGQEHAGSNTRLLPAVEAAAESGDATSRAPSAAESYLPDVAALVAAGGGRLVVVLPPVAALKAADHAVPAEAERDIVETANALGVGLVDLRAMALTDLDYTDGYHMRPEARRVFTAELAAQLVTIGALGSGPMRASWVPPAFTVTRSPPPPAIPLGAPEPGEGDCAFTAALSGMETLADDRLRLVGGHLPAPFVLSDAAGPLTHLRRAPGPCSGGWIFNKDRVYFSTRAPGPAAVTLAWNDALPARDEDGEAAWWVYAGGNLDVTWPDGLGTGPVGADVEVIDPSGGAVVEAELGGLRVPVEGVGSLRRAHVAVDSAPSPLTLRVTSDRAIVVRSLTLTFDGRELVVVRPPSARLVDLFPGEIEGPPPPAIAPARMRIVRGRPAFPAPFEDTLGCSPVRVTEDGVELPSGAVATSTTNRPNGLVVDHVRGDVFVVTPDGSSPLGNGREYRLAWTADRACRGKLKRASVSRAWVYDGETIASTVDPLPPVGAEGPMRGLRVRVEANDTLPAGATARFLLRSGEAVRLDTTVPLDDLAGGAELALPEPLTRRDRGALRLEVTVAGAGMPVLVSAAGVEG